MTTDSPTELPLAACCVPPAREATECGCSTPRTGPTPPGEREAARPLDYAGMKRLDGGPFLMGTDSEQQWRSDGEGPVREVQLDPFWIDACAVTNEQFEQFVTETAYTTEAENFGWSYVFHRMLTPKARQQARGVAGTAQWWVAVDGACWRAPEGPGSNLKKRPDHPVVHISWNDAAEYCKWAGKRLPTEAEWEYAARGGLVQQLYPWGPEFTGKTAKGQIQYRCNTWQGKFPELDTGADGYAGTAPVKSFSPNGFGLYNMSGNAWEWCSDWFSPVFHVNGPRVNPRGPTRGENKVIKGGSFLCHVSYCNRYRVSARTGNTPDSTSAHCGFRCAADV